MKPTTHTQPKSTVRKASNAKRALAASECFEPVSPVFQPAGRARGISHAGVPLVSFMLRKLHFADTIAGALSFFKTRRGYSEADHVVNLALNPLFGGMTLDDIGKQRNDEALLNAINARSLPHPTTAGDFCRRFSTADIDALQEAINAVRIKVWKAQPASFFEVARIDADGVFVPTSAECAEGVDYSGHKKDWGYHPLVVSLAQTQEPLFLVNRSGARPSHEGAHLYLDKAIALCRRAGFRSVLLRGDTDFSQTKFLDDWHDEGVHFAFGIDAMPNLIAIAQDDDLEWKLLSRHTRPVEEEEERARPHRHKLDRIIEREFRHLELEREEVSEFDYTPTACKRPYRVVVVRKTIRVTKGSEMLAPEVRFFFYITNLSALAYDGKSVVAEARQRCNQENLNSHLKSGVQALRSPLGTLASNWAYMVMTALGWSFKAWVALLSCSSEGSSEGKAMKERLLTMEFRTFLRNFVEIPCLVLTTGRRLVLRLLGESCWTPHFLRIAAHLRE